MKPLFKNPRLRLTPPSWREQLMVAGIWIAAFALFLGSERWLTHGDTTGLVTYVIGTVVMIGAGIVSLTLGMTFRDRRLRTRYQVLVFLAGMGAAMPTQYVKPPSGLLIGIAAFGLMTLLNAQFTRHPRFRKPEQPPETQFAHEIPGL